MVAAVLWVLHGLVEGEMSEPTKPLTLTDEECVVLLTKHISFMCIGNSADHPEAIRLIRAAFALGAARQRARAAEIARRKADDLDALGHSGGSVIRDIAAAIEADGGSK